MQNDTTRVIVQFLMSIGLPVVAGEVPANSFLPGIGVQHGCLVVDEAALRYPGDLLHEAGHLAVKTPADRAQRSGNIGADMREEVGAIAWSYAAALHIGIDPAIVFHAHGYRGQSEAILDEVRRGQHMGVAMLQYLQLTYDKKRAAQHGVAPYPHMIRWLRES